MPQFLNNIILYDLDIVFGTSVGTKIGTSTSQKIGLYGVTPVAQQANNISLETVLSNIGIRAAGANAPLSIGALTTNDNITIADGKNIVLDTTTGTKIGTSTSQKLGFFNATPVIQQGGTTDIKDALTSYGLFSGTSASPLNLDGGILTAGSATLNSSISILTLSGSSVAAISASIKGVGLYLTTAASDVSVPGVINITAGSGTGYAGGSVSIVSGGSSSTDAGDVTLDTGPGTAGNIYLKNNTTSRIQINQIGIGFFGATPVAQQSNSTSLETVLSNLGLRAAGTTAPLACGDLTVTSPTEWTFGAKLKTTSTQTGSGNVPTFIMYNQSSTTGTGGSFRFTQNTTSGGEQTVAQIFGLSTAVTSTNLTGSAGITLQNAGSLFNTFLTKVDGTLVSANHAGFNSTLKIQNTNYADNGTRGAGISFVNDGVDSPNIGAKINFIRTASYSGGDLVFYTSPGGSAGDQTIERMRISAAGNLTANGNITLGGQNKNTSIQGGDTGQGTSIVQFKDYNGTVVGRVDGAGHLNLSEGKNIILGTTTGTKIGTATNQKIGFFNATPVIQQGGTTDIKDALTSYGLFSGTSASPMNLDGGALTAGAISGTTGSFTGLVNTTGILQAWNRFYLGQWGDLALIGVTDGQSVVATWWGMQLAGNRQSSNGYTPSNFGTRDSANVIIPVSQPGTPGLIIIGNATQTGNLQEFKNSAGTLLTSIGVTGKLTLPASTTAASSLRLTPGTAPTSPNNGDIWVDSSEIYARINDVTYKLDKTAV